jgi:hypothetical protein
MTSTDPKQWALMTGFPLENDIESLLNEALSDLNLTMERNYEFETADESGESVIRSIDFLCSFKKKTWNIPLNNWRPSVDDGLEVNLLIDAKYSPDEKYLFLPVLQNRDAKWPYLVPCVVENDDDESFGREIFFREDLVAFAALPNVRVASHGRKVKEISKERDSVTSAVLQVVQGLTHLFENRANALGEPSKRDYFRSKNAHYFLPIVVTNSPLYLLKKCVGIEAIGKAKNDAEYLETQEAVALQIPKTQQLLKSWNKAKQALSGGSGSALAWQEGGIEHPHILFCTPSGLKNFVRDLRKKFSNIPENPT